MFQKSFEIKKAHNDPVYAIEFISEHVVASGDDDGVIKIWDLHTGYLLQTLSGHSSDITSVSFSANGKTLVSASRDRTIKVWQL